MVNFVLCEESASGEAAFALRSSRALSRMATGMHMSGDPVSMYCKAVSFVFYDLVPTGSQDPDPNSLEKNHQQQYSDSTMPTKVYGRMRSVESYRWLAIAIKRP
eukprot:5735819-Pleurochrysis_carterae.AAC.1